MTIIKVMASLTEIKMADLRASIALGNTDSVVAWFDQNAENYQFLVDQAKYNEIVDSASEITKNVLVEEGLAMKNGRDGNDLLQALDVGCGSGFAAKGVLNNGIRAVFDGIDPSAGLLELAINANIYTEKWRERR